MTYRKFTPYLLLMLLFSACESPGERVGRLRKQLLVALSEQEYFEFSAGSKQIKWPLPPSGELAEKKKQQVLKIREELATIDPANMQVESQMQYQHLKQQLEELSNQQLAFFDPAQFVIDEFLDDKTTPEERKLLLPHIREYYTRIENRWTPPAASRAKLAMKKSLMVLEKMEAMGAETQEAQLAVKDFIGLCQSALLDH